MEWKILKIYFTLQKIYQEVQFWVVTPRSITAT